MVDLERIGTIERYLRKNGSGFDFPKNDRLVMKRNGNGLWIVSNCGDFIGFSDNDDDSFKPLLLQSKLLVDRLDDNVCLRYKRRTSEFLISLDDVEVPFNIKIGNGKVIEDLRSFDYTGDDYLVDSLEKLLDNCLEGNKLFLYRTCVDLSDINSEFKRRYFTTFSNQKPDEQVYNRISDLKLMMK